MVVPAVVSAVAAGSQLPSFTKEQHADRVALCACPILPLIRQHSSDIGEKIAVLLHLLRLEIDSLPLSVEAKDIGRQLYLSFRIVLQAMEVFLQALKRSSGVATVQLARDELCLSDKRIVLTMGMSGIS